MTAGPTVHVYALTAGGPADSGGNSVAGWSATCGTITMRR